MCKARICLAIATNVARNMCKSDVPHLEKLVIIVENQIIMQDTAYCSQVKRTSSSGYCSKRKKHSDKEKTGQYAHSTDIQFVFTVESTDAEGLTQTLLVLDTPLEFQLDTGATMSLISRSQWEKLGSPKLCVTKVIPTNFRWF